MNGKAHAILVLFFGILLFLGMVDECRSERLEWPAQSETEDLTVEAEDLRAEVAELQAQLDAAHGEVAIARNMSAVFDACESERDALEDASFETTCGEPWEMLDECYDQLHRCEDDREEAMVRRPEHDHLSMVGEAYELGREAVELERVKAFIACLDREVGHPVRGEEIEQHIKDDTDAARRCR